MSTNTGRLFLMSGDETMNNWQENEIKELLNIRGSEAIRNQITGTVKDSVVYNRITKQLAERGVHRSHMQVISKLKALRKQYIRYQQKTRRGGPRVHWPFYEQCHAVFGSAPERGPVKRSASPVSPAAAPPTVSGGDQDEVVVGIWDEEEDGDMNQHLGPVEAEDGEEQYSPSEPLHAVNTAYVVPSKKRKTTVMDQVSTLVSATVAQLREMDAAMQAQEDARLQRLMEHEREMQNSLMSQLVAMHERIGRENHDRNLQLVDRILSRFPSASAPPGR